MSVDLDQACSFLNLDQNSDDLTKLGLYIDGANEWVGSKVEDTTTATAVLATLELIRHWWEPQRGPSAAPVDEEFVEIDSRSYAIPNWVAQLLGLGGPAAPAGASSFPCARAWPDPVEWP